MNHKLAKRLVKAGLAAAAILAIGLMAPQSATALDPSAGEPGIHYRAADFRALAHKPSFVMVELRNPDDVVAFATKADFDRAVAAAQTRVNEQAGTQSAGQYAVIYSDDELRGDSLRIESGWGINDLRGVARGCGLFGCAGNWNDVISSVFVNGSVTLYTDPNYTGGWFWMGGYGWFNMSTYGFDNTFSSMNVWWS